MNLKYILMTLGNRLVTERGFFPAAFQDQPNTTPIDQFTKWLNDTPEAQEILEEMGIEWPMRKD